MSNKVTYRVSYSEIMDDNELAQLEKDCKKEIGYGYNVSLTVVMTKAFDIYTEEEFVRRLLDNVSFTRIKLEDDKNNGMYCQQVYELQEYLQFRCNGNVQSDGVQYFFIGKKLITLAYEHQGCMHLSSCIPGTMRQV